MAETRRRGNSSAVTFPIEVLFNIVIYLPVICLLRMKSVCKSWYFLITSREFANDHLRRNALSSDHLLIFSGDMFNSLYSVNLDTLESRPVKIPFPSVSEGIGRKKIVGSSNGLLLCLCDETFSFEAILMSSSSLPCKLIPKLEVPLNCLYINYGLGYDFGFDDYKVVRMVHFLSGSVSLRKTMEVMVYSLRADSWKLAKSNIPINWTPISKYGALVNNSLLHWLFRCSSLNMFRIACFDVSSEEWGEIPMVDYENERVDLGTLDGCLCLLIGGEGVNFMELDVWIMKEYGVKDSWVKLFDFIDLCVIGSLSMPPIAYCQEGSEILLKRDYLSSVFLYNSDEKRLETAAIRGLSNYGPLSTCIRTLIRPCSNDQITDRSFPTSTREGFY